MLAIQKQKTIKKDSKKEAKLTSAGTKSSQIIKDNGKKEEPKKRIKEKGKITKKSAKKGKSKK